MSSASHNSVATITSRPGLPGGRWHFATAALVALLGAAHGCGLDFNSRESGPVASAIFPDQSGNPGESLGNQSTQAVVNRFMSETPVSVTLEVRRWSGAGSPLQFGVVATYGDGTHEDVTAFATFLETEATSGPDVALLEISSSGDIRYRLAGTAKVNARLVGIDSQFVEVASTHASPTTPTVSFTASSTGSVANSVYAQSALTCRASGSVDPEGTAVDYEFTWSGISGDPVRQTGQDGSVTESYITRNDDRGSQVTCSVAARDGAAEALTSHRVSGDVFTVVDRAPSRPTVSLYQAIGTELKVGGQIRCLAQGSIDPDGDGVAYEFRWKNISTGSKNRESNSSETYTIAENDIGKPISCEARAVSKIDDTRIAAASPWGSSVQALELEALPPVITSLTLQHLVPDPSTLPANTTVAYPGDVLACTAVGHDPNGLTVRWGLTGGDVTRVKIFEIRPDMRNKTITCAAQLVNSQGLKSLLVERTMTVNNRAPNEPEVTIASFGSNIVAGTTLSCNANGTDPDGDQLIPQYSWSGITGSVNSAASNTYTVTESDTSPITCSVTMCDVYPYRDIAACQLAIPGVYAASGPTACCHKTSPAVTASVVLGNNNKPNPPSVSSIGAGISTNSGQGKVTGIWVSGDGANPPVATTGYLVAMYPTTTTWSPADGSVYSTGANLANGVVIGYAGGGLNGSTIGGAVGTLGAQFDINYGRYNYAVYARGANGRYSDPVTGEFTVGVTVRIVGPTPSLVRAERDSVYWDVIYDGASSITLSSAQISPYGSPVGITSGTPIIAIVNATTRRVTIGNISGAGTLRFGIAANSAQSPSGNALAVSSIKATPVQVEMRNVPPTDPVVTMTHQDGVLTCSAVSTDANNDPFTYTRQWTRDGDAIAGATGETYALSLDDEYTTIRCEVYAADAWLMSNTVESAGHAVQHFCSNFTSITAHDGILGYPTVAAGANNPYLLCNAAQLTDIADQCGVNPENGVSQTASCSKHFRLKQNLDMSAVTWTDKFIGTINGFGQTNVPFTGSIAGGGAGADSIRGLTIVHTGNVASIGCPAFVPYLNYPGSLKNFALDRLTVSGVARVSAISCLTSVPKTNLSGIRVTGVVSADRAFVIGQNEMTGSPVSSGEKIDFAGLLLTPTGGSKQQAILSTGVVDKFTAFVTAAGNGGPRLPWGQDSVVVGGSFAKDLTSTSYGTHASLFSPWAPGFLTLGHPGGTDQSGTYWTDTPAQSTRQLAVSRVMDYDPVTGAVVVNYGQGAVFDTYGPGLTSRPCLSTTSSGGTVYTNRAMRNVTNNVFASINSAVMHGPEKGLGPNSSNKVYDCTSGSAPYPEHIPTILTDAEAYPASLTEAMTQQTYSDRSWDFVNTWDFDDALPYLRTTSFPISYFNATAGWSGEVILDIQMSLTKSASTIADTIKIYSRPSNSSPRVMPSCSSVIPGTLIGTLTDLSAGMKTMQGGTGLPGATDLWLCAYKEGNVVIDGMLVQSDVRPPLFRVTDLASVNRLQFELFLYPEVVSTFQKLKVIEGNADASSSGIPTYCGNSANSNIVAELDLAGASTLSPLTLQRSLNSPQSIEAGHKVSYLLCGEMKSSFAAANAWADQGAAQPAWMSPMVMIRDVETRGAPALSDVAFSPASPSYSTTPTVTASLSMDGTVAFFSDSDCATALTIPVLRSVIEGSGAVITVAENATTSVYARTFALDGTPSNCNLAGSYVNSTSVPSLTFIGNSTSSTNGYTRAGPVILDGFYTADTYNTNLCSQLVVSGTANATVSPVFEGDFQYTLTGFTGDGTVRIKCAAGALSNNNGLTNGEILGPLIYVDNTAPTLGGNQSVLLGASGTLDVTATDAGSGVSSVNWTQISGTVGAINLSSWTTLTPTVTATQAGTYGLRLTVSDAVGNTATRDFTVVWDTSSPIVSISAPSVTATNGSRNVYWQVTVSGTTTNPSAATLSNLVSINVTGTVAATKLVRVAGDANNDGVVDSVDMNIVQNGGKYDTGQPATWEEGDFTGDGIINFDDITALFPNYGNPSPTSYVVRATSLSGNGTVGFTVGTGAFTNAVGTGSAATTSQTATVDSISPTFSLTAGVIASSQVSIAPTAVNDSGSGVASYAWTYTTTGGGTINWSGSENSSTATVTASADGNYTLKLRVTDNAGNYLERTSTLTWSTVVPQVVIDRPSDSGYLSAGTYSMSFPLTFQNCATTQSNSALASTYIVQLFEEDPVADNSASNFTDVTTNSSGVASTCSATPSRCSYRQNKAGLEWTDEFSARPWAEAFAHCRDLTYNGHSDWYLPGTPHIKRGTQAFTDRLNQMVLPNAVWLSSGDYLWSGSWNPGYTFTGLHQSSWTYNATSPASAPASPATNVDAISGYVNQNESVRTSLPFLCTRSAYARAGTVNVSGAGSSRTVTLSNITGGDGMLGLRVLPGACSTLAGTTNQETDIIDDLYFIDTTPPVVTLSGVPANASGPFNMTVTVQDSSYQVASNFTIESYLLVPFNATTRTLTTQVLSSTTVNATTKSYVVSVAGDIDINYDFGVKVEDIYGNVGIATGAFTLSTTAATVAIGSPSDLGPVDQTTTVSYPVTYSGASNIILPSYTGDLWDITDTVNLPEFIEVDWDGSGYVELAITGSGNNYQVVVYNSGASGTFSFRFLPGTATNAGGQSDSGSNWSTPIVFDNSAPVLTVGGGGSTAVTATAPTTLTVAAVDPQSSMTYQWTNLSPAVGTISFGTANAASTTIQASAAGTYQIRFTATNAVGLSSSVTYSFTWAPVAPTVTISSPSSAITNGATINYSVTFTGAQSVAFNSSKITLNKTGTANATVSVSGSGSSYTVSLVPSGNGTVGITVAGGSATNYGVGNSATTSSTFAVDTAAPVITAANIPNTGVPVSTSWSVSDTNSYTVLWTKVSGPGTINFTAPTATTTTISATSGGTYTVRMTATDVAGNTSYAERSFVWNSTAPGISISSPSLAQTRNSNVTYTVTYSGATSVTLASGNITLNKTGTANASVAVTGSGNSTRTVTLSSVSGNGTIGISIASGTATNNAGISAPTAGPSTTFKVDNSAPTVSVGNIGAISSATTITATASDPNLATGVSGVGGLTYSWSKNSGPGTLIFGSPSAASTTVSATSDGNYNVQLTVTDAVGNSTTTFPKMTWAATRPTLWVANCDIFAASGGAQCVVTYDGYAANINLTSANISLTKTGSVTGGSISSIFVDGADAFVDITGLSGTGTFALVVAPGTATNIAGLADNTGATSTAYSVDLNVPPAPTAFGFAGSNGQGLLNDYYTAYPAFWSVWGPCDASIVDVLVFVDGVQRATTSCESGNYYTIVNFTLSAGSHNITFKGVNASGIVSGSSANLLVIVDTSLPSLSSLSIVGGNSGTTPTPTVSFSLTENTGTADVRLYNNSSCTTSISNWNTVTSGSGKTITTSYSFGPRPENIYIRAKDGAGNLSSCSLVGNYVYSPPTAVMAPTVTQGDTFANGYCSADLTVKLGSGTPGATIYYTTNGSTPTTSSYLYNPTNGIALSAWSYNVTIKAIAVKSGMLDSAVLAKTWTLGTPYEVLATVTGLGTGKSLTTNLRGDSLSSASTTVATTKTMSTNGSKVSSYGWCNGNLAYHATIATQPTGQTCYVAYKPNLAGPTYTPKKVWHEDDGTNASVHTVNCVDDAITAPRFEVSFEDLYGTTNPTFAIGSYEKDSDYNDLNVCLSMNGALSGNNFTKSLVSNNFRMVSNVSGTLGIDWYSDTVCPHPFRVKVYRNGTLMNTASAVGSISRGGGTGPQVTFQTTGGSVPEVLMADLGAAQPSFVKQHQDSRWIPGYRTLYELVHHLPPAVLIALFVMFLLLSELFVKGFRQLVFRLSMIGAIVAVMLPGGADRQDNVAYAFGQIEMSTTGGFMESSSTGDYMTSSSTGGYTSSSSTGDYMTSSSTGGYTSSSSTGGYTSSSSTGGYTSSSSTGGSSGGSAATISGIMIGDVIEVEMDNPAGSTCANYGASSTIYSKFRDQAVIRGGCAIFDIQQMNANSSLP